MKLKPASRRRFLKEGAAFAGLAVGARSVSGQTLGSGPAHDQGMALAFGERSRFAKLLRIPNTVIGAMGLHGDEHGLGARTPLSALTGTITPSALHYVSSHGNAPPDIDPHEHRLMIYGMVDRPLVLSMDELMRLPAVTRIHYIECVVNGPHPKAKTLDDSQGMLACSEWTGVPLSVLLKEVGVQAGANWVMGEGADATKISTAMPLGKAMDDALVAYGQNGEPVRPHQGFPLRLVVPGFQGKYHVKWLRFIKVIDRPYMTYWEKHHYLGAEARSEPPDTNRRLGYNEHLRGKGVFLEQGPKSVITFPSGEQRLPNRGYYTISGLAWSGCGAVRRVEVSTDGGKSWNDAEIEGPAHRIALTRFTAPLTWNGGEAVLQSRCTDDKGQVQPTAAEHVSFWGGSGSAAPHNNSIQPWRVTDDGTIRSAL